MANREPIQLAGRTPTEDSLTARTDITDDVEQRQQARKALRQHQIALVIAGFLMNFNVFGINLSYGIFQVRRFALHAVCVGVNASLGVLHLEPDPSP